MSVLGAVSLEVGLDFSTLDSQLQSLDGRTAKPIKLKIDSQDFKKQVAALEASPLPVSLQIDLNQFPDQIKSLSAQIDPIKVDLRPNLQDFQKKLNRGAKTLDAIPISLSLDIGGLKATLKQLPTQLDPVKVDLSPNFQDFQEKLRRLEKISQISIDLDAAGIKDQFTGIGRQAREGFIEGFSAEDIGQAAGAVITKSVKDELQIQSPSKVFRQLGESAIQGFVAGLISGESGIESAARNIEKSFSNLNLKIKVQFDARGLSVGSSVGLGARTTRTGRSEKSNDDIIKALDRGFKKLEPRGGGLLGSIGSIIKAPFEQAATGLLEGLGAPLGEQLGQGLLKGLQSRFGKDIGSFELLAQKATEKGLDIIPAAQESIIKAIEANPIGSAIVRQLEVVQAILERFNIKLPSPQDIVPQREAAATSSAIRFESQQEEFGIQKKARAAAGIDFVSTAEQLPQVEEISKLVSASENRVQQLSSDVTKSQKQIAAGVYTQQDVQLLSEASSNLEAESKNLQGLKEAKQAFIEKLNNQIKTLATLGVEGELSTKALNLVELQGTFEELLTSQKAIQESRKAININANTPEGIRQQKLERLQTNSASAEQNLQAALSNPESSVDEINRLQKIAENTKKALELYNVELQNPAKEIEALNVRLQAVDAELAATISQLTARISKSLPDLVEKASLEIVKVAGRAPQPQVEIPQSQSKSAKSSAPLPAAYQQILEEVATRSGVSIDRDRIPTPVANDKLPTGFRAYYNPEKNQVNLSPATFESLKSGQLDPETTNDLVHELRHAFQFDFGRLSPNDKPGVNLLSPNAEEIQTMGTQIEGSARIHPEELQPAARRLEADAYTFAARNTPEIYQGIQKQQAIKDFESKFGIGGVGANSQIKQQINAAVKEIKGYAGLSQEYGVDIRQEMLATIAKLETIKKYIEQAVNKVGAIDELPASEVQAFKEKLQTAVDTAGQIIRSTVKGFKETEKIQSLEQLNSPSPQPIAAIEPISLPAPFKSDLNFNSSQEIRSFIEENLNAKGVRDLARRMGIETKNANKEFLTKEISAFGGTAESREQIAQYASRLSPDKFLVGANYQPNLQPSPEAERVIAQLKESRRTLADILKSVGSVDAESQRELLGQIAKQAEIQGATAKQLISEHQVPSGQAQSLGGLQAQFRNLADQAKAQLVAIGENLSQGIASGLSATAQIPVAEMRQVMSKIEQAARDEAEIHSPSRKLEIIGGFIAQGLALGIESGIPLVEEAAFKMLNAITGTPLRPLAAISPETIEEINQANLEQLNQRAAKYDVQHQILEDLQADNEKNQQRAQEAIDPNRREYEREDIQERARISANLERKHGLEGFAPEILPNRINESGDELPELPSVVESIQEGLAAIDRNIINRLKKRSAQLALEAETGIAPGLDVSAAQARQRGDEAAASQYEELAQKTRSASGGIAEILESPELTEKQYQQLRQLNGELEDVYNQIGRPLPNENFLDQAAFSIKGVTQSLLESAKGFIAFQAFFWVQDALRSVSVEAFNAYTELDRFKTALDFSSSGAGAQGLRFVRKEADDLKIPLRAAIEAYTELQAATRNTPLEGKEANQLSYALNEVSTVLSLTPEDTKGISDTISKAISRGKIGAEVFDELGTRIPGAQGIAARSLGISEAQLAQMSESGGINATDFASRFGRELHAEFGESAKSASGNAQSAVYDLQNSVYDLQTGIGQQIAPAATQGINLLSTSIKAASKLSAELASATLALSIALSGRLLVSLYNVAQSFITLNAAGGTFRGLLGQVGQTLNTSPTVAWTVGIFAAVEAVHLLNDAINTDLIQSFNNAADSAKKAAEESERAFLSASGKPPLGDTKHISSNGVGQFFDNIIDFLNTDVGPIPGGVGGAKLRTYGDKEYQESLVALDLQGASRRDLIGSGRLQLDNIVRGIGNDAGLVAISKELNEAEQNRAILEARIQRDYANQGKTTPANLRFQLQQDSQIVNQLNDKRSGLAKNVNALSANTEGQIGVVKSQLDRLDQPDALQVFGSQSEIDERRGALKDQLDDLRKLKAEIENVLGALHVDPVLSFNQALRQLNLAFAKSAEMIKNSLTEGKLVNSQKALAGFFINRFASKDEGLANAQIELNAARQNEAALGKDYFGSRQAVDRPEFQPTLKRLGVSPNSSIAEIEDRLQDKNLPDEDKSLLEKLKSVAGLREQYIQARQSTITAQRGLQSSVQESGLFNLDERATNQKDALQIRENLQTASIKRQQQAKLITEEEVNLELAKLQAKDTLNQKQNNEKELADLKLLHDRKIVGAEEYERRSRDLLTEHSVLEKQASENDLSVQQAMLQKRIKAYEYANAHAEAVISTTQVSSASGIKEKELAAGLTQPAKDEAAIQQSKVDEQAVVGRIALLKQEMAQNRDLYKEGLRDSRDFAKEQERLNQELAQANGQLIDSKIQAEENWRAQAEHAIQRVQQAEEGRIKLSESGISQQKASLELYNSSLERTAKLEEARQNLTKAISEEQISSLDNSRNAANQALELAKKLQDDKLDPRLANAIRRQLVASKFLQPRDINADAGSIELAVLDRRNKIEEEIFNKKMAALAAEQSFQEESLKIELQKEKIAAQMAIYDAQSAQLAAAKSRLEAESALRIAKIKGDQDGIKEAEIGLQIADRESTLADRRLASSEENLQIQQELGQDAIGKQRAAQAESLNALNAENDSRKQSEGIERVQTVVDLLTKKGEKSKDDAKFYSQIAIPFTPVAPTEPIDVVEEASSSDAATTKQVPQSFSTNPMPIDFNPSPGEDIFSAYSKYNAERNPIKIPENKPGEDLFAAYSRQNATRLQESPFIANSKSSDPQQTVDGLKDEVRRIGTKLDNLIDKMSSIAGRPSVLHVSSPRPVDDAADIYHQMSKNAVQNSGL